MIGDIFKAKEYKDNKDPITHYGKIAASVLSTMNNVTNPLGKIKKYINDNKLFKDPRIKFHERDLKGNRSIKVTTLHEYIKYAKKSGDIIVPSFTVYFSRKKKESLHAEFINVNVNLRSKHKKLALKYGLANDAVKSAYHEVIQKVMKIFNNSLSGAYASMGTILNNASAHYTLTSITRGVSGIGNAVSEALISGNRHYKDPDITFNHIATTVYTADTEAIKEAVETYNLRIPTPKEVMFSILRSSSLYWRDLEKEQIILEYLTKINDYERCAVLYNNDLYQIRQFNPKFTRELIDKILDYEIQELTMEECDIVIKDTEEWVYNLAVHVNMTVMSGKRIDQLDLEGKRKMASFMLGVTSSLVEYTLFVQTFLVTEVFPPAIAYIKEMVRKAIVLSDTDSTCATYRSWVNWYFGKDVFNDRAVGVAATVMSIVTLSTDHYIKAFAGNMGMNKKEGSYLEMKNEFFWDVFVNTNVSKHYFANVKIREGNVFNKPKLVDSLEKKGVNLIAPNAYVDARNISEDLMVDIMHKVGSNQKISLKETLDTIKKAEELIYKKIVSGSPDVLKLEKIKPAKSYTVEPHKSNYVYYTLWQDVFSDKYGNSPDPQYMAVKIPTTLTTKRAMSEFVDSINDDSIRNKFKAFLILTGKTTIPTFRLPLIIIYTNGIPKELLSVIDYKRVIKDNVNHLYMILESLGYYIKEGDTLMEILDNIDVNKNLSNSII